MRIISTGIDLVEIARIREVMTRHEGRFVNRIYTPDERRRLASLKDPAPYLAGRWAVKEAVLKVLGTGLTRGITWHDVNVTRDAAGAPIVQLANKAAERAKELGIDRILVSISHGRDLAVAQALGVAETL